MDLQQFEQEILRLAFETETRITTASVAYYLGIPSREANAQLNRLLEEGVLELDSDASGNLYYSVPNQADVKAIAELKISERANIVDVSKSNAFGATLDDEGGEAFMPLIAEHSIRAHGSKPIPRDHALIAAESAPVMQAPSDIWGSNPSTDTDPDGSTGSRSVIVKKNNGPVWSGVATRAASTDGTVGTSGGSPFLVATKVRCESRPLPSAKPEVASCNDPVPNVTALANSGTYGTEQSWFGARTESTAMVPAGANAEGALSRDYYIENPEHQPGMALLLSLILCGTGQIYNGEVSKGIMMMVLCFLLWFVLLGWVVHIWSIVDAVVVAERLNRKEA